MGLSHWAFRFFGVAYSRPSAAGLAKAEARRSGTPPAVQIERLETEKV
jgi:hypothetical protein